ncbi:hypothetical protein [Klebsiella quasipneumoniae]|uniref:hypothetical protein n=1 Tax=Klebsiella quasipneumoniae TaxID=1463165 RepID=UPI002946620C|nr:hypothetical protein [Raoultella ornithinolytica]
MKHEQSTDKSISPDIVIMSGTKTIVSTGCHLGTVVADMASPVTIPVTSEDNLLPRIEARLAEEVSDLVSALRKFGLGTQRISEELPVSSEFGKLITSFFSASSLQLANALLQSKDRPLLLDDGAMQLYELGLSLNDFIREVDLEGRKYLAIALINKSFSQRTDRRKCTD